jgi:hypothetical protein
MRPLLGLTSRTAISLAWSGVVGLTGAMGVVGVVAPAPNATGQEQRMVFTRSLAPGGDGYTPVSSRELESYGRTLGFDQGQSEAAGMLLEGYRDAVRAAQEERRKTTEQARLEFEDSRDHQVMMEGMRKSGERYRERTDELEASFFNDLKSLATGEQLDRWAKVERARRRERLMGQGPVSTANVDVIKLLEQADGSWRQGEHIQAILERYELQLDGLLGERARAGAALDQAPLGRFDEDLLAQMNKAQEKQREVALRIRQLNDATLAELAALVEDAAERGELEMAYQKAKFPRVYREAHTQRLLAAASGFDDLSGPQREAVQSLQAAYEAQAASLNGRWARELAEAEKSGAESSGGMVIRMGDFGGQEEETALARASKARRELDQDFESRLRDVLDEAQEARLPERERRNQEQWVGEAEAVIIRGG